MDQRISRITIAESLTRPPAQHLRVLYLTAQEAEHLIQRAERPALASLDVFDVALPSG